MRLPRSYIYSHVRSRLLYWIERSHGIASSPARLARAKGTHSLAAESLVAQSNVILMGCPGSGKTTIGKMVAKRLGLPFVDIDDDLLEPYWGMTVAAKLAQVGSGCFVEEEGKAFLTLSSSKSIVSLTGSNPLYAPAMDHAKNIGVVIYLDVPIDDILERLHRMKVNRIVGQETGATMEHILKYRLQFYERYYDYRVICSVGEHPESIADKVAQVVDRWRDSAVDSFTSTRAEGTTAVRKSLLQVTLEGLAPDRGLYVRTPIRHRSTPVLTAGQWARLVKMPYAERAQRILELWIRPDQIEPSRLQSMISRAYSMPEFGNPDCDAGNGTAPVVHLRGSNRFILELFWGPTASFKDFALQLTPQIFEHAARNAERPSNSTRARRYLILVATSGDTGGAVLNGFSRLADQCDVMVFFPENGVSVIQKAQMTSIINERMKVIGVKGDFDFCQSTIKKIFIDADFIDTLHRDTGFALSAANSINLARLLPQVVYHASSYLDLVKDGHISFGTPVDIVVPTGNFGNITAAYYAKSMGIPFGRLVCASNTNNVLTNFFNEGVYDISERKLQLTASPAIDILRSSNLERYVHALSDGDSALVCDMFESIDKTGRYVLQKNSETFHKMHEHMVAGWCNEYDCTAEIKSTLKNHGYLLDPHTAVAKVVADRLLQDGRVSILAATAHYSKFADSVATALNVLPSTPDCQGDAVWLLDRLESAVRRNHVSPAPHHLLRRDVTGMRYHRDVCEPVVNELLSRVKLFAESRRQTLDIDCP